jgi:hypothetical protein
MFSTRYEGKTGLLSKMGQGKAGVISRPISLKA